MFDTIPSKIMVKEVDILVYSNIKGQYMAKTSMRVVHRCVRTHAFVIMDKFWDMIEISSASHYSDQSMIKLTFSAAWVVLDFSKEVTKIFVFL